MVQAEPVILVQPLGRFRRAIQPGRHAIRMIAQAVTSAFAGGIPRHSQGVEIRHAVNMAGARPPRKQSSRELEANRLSLEDCMHTGLRRLGFVAFVTLWVGSASAGFCWPIIEPLSALHSG